MATTQLNEHFLKADRVMRGITWGLAAYALLLCGLNDGNWGLALAASIGIGGIATLVHAIAPGTPLSRCVFAAGLMALTGLHIHLAHGMIEMHFGVFVCLAILLYYRDWVPIVVAAAVIAVHHVGFFMMQSAGWPVYVFNHPGHGWSMVFLHAAYVVVESILLGFMAIDTRKAALQGEALWQLADHMSPNNKQQISLTFRHSLADELIQRMNGVVSALDSTIGRVLSAGDQLTRSSAELNSHTSQISQEARQQQQDVQYMVNAIDEMGRAVHDVSQNAEQASLSANAADRDSKAGINALYQTQQEIRSLAQTIDGAGAAVGKLATEANHIGSVVDVIRGIAEQTNLLALNAAIEAARAGEQGRGFAVVADEVRSLASRTQQSTEEIRQMIGNLQVGSEEAVRAITGSQSGAGRCVSLTEETVRLLENVTEAVNAISQMNHLIATATHEQSAVTNELGRNAGNMRQSTDSANHHAQQVSDLGQQLSSLSQELQQLAGQFVVSRG